MPDYFTLAEFRALPDMDDTVRYTDDRVNAAAAYIVGILEREVGTCFIERTVTAELHDGGSDRLVLDHPHVRSITSATEDGVAITDSLRVSGGGVLRRYSSASSYVPLPFAAGSQNISVTYVRGYSASAPSDIKEAALQGTRARLLDTDSRARVNDRTRSITNDAGGTTEFVLAGPDHPTGYPEVDAVIVGWRDQLDNYGFA